MTIENLALKFPDVMGIYRRLSHSSQLHILCPHFWARCLMLVTYRCWLSVIVWWPVKLQGAA